MTLNEEQADVLLWRRTRLQTGGVWRAERRCRGDDVNMVKIMRETDESSSNVVGYGMVFTRRRLPLPWMKDLTSRVDVCQGHVVSW